jgi:hypothetical protein
MFRKLQEENLVKYRLCEGPHATTGKGFCGAMRPANSMLRSERDSSRGQGEKCSADVRFQTGSARNRTSAMLSSSVSPSASVYKHEN